MRCAALHRNQSPLSLLCTFKSTSSHACSCTPQTWGTVCRWFVCVCGGGVFFMGGLYVCWSVVCVCMCVRACACVCGGEGGGGGGCTRICAASANSDSSFAEPSAGGTAPPSPSVAFPPGAPSPSAAAAPRALQPSASPSAGAVGDGSGAPEAVNGGAWATVDKATGWRQVLGRSPEVSAGCRRGRICAVSVHGWVLLWQ